MPTPTKRNQPSLSTIPYSAACRRVNVLSRLYGIYRDLAQCVGGASSRVFSLSLFVRSSVFLLSIHAHAQRSPREKQSLDSHKNTTRLRGEIFGEKSSEHAGNIFFPSYYSLAHFMRYTLVRLNGVSRRIFFFPFSVFLTDGWYDELNFSLRFDWLIIIVDDRDSFVHRKEGNLLVRKRLIC